MATLPPPMPPSGQLGSSPDEGSTEHSEAIPMELAGEVLAPRYGLAASVALLGPAALTLQPIWPAAQVLALVLTLLGLFLLLQTTLLRLECTAEALVVWRQQTLLRRFPYDEWLGWRLFWPALPVLLYFRERRSIHLLPVLFDAAGLQRQLEQRLPQLIPQAPAATDD